MQASLQNKVAFITGASRGIGQACAIALAQAGAHCIINGRNEAGLTQTENIIQSNKGHVTTLPLDFGGYESSLKIDLIGPSIASEFNRLDIFIHAAFQYVSLTPVSQITDTIWEKNIQTNLSASWRLIRTLSPILCATKNANAIFINPIITSIQPFCSPITMIHKALEVIIESWKQEVASLSTLKIHTITVTPTNTLLRKSLLPAENNENLNTAEQTAAEIISFIR